QVFSTALSTWCKRGTINRALLPIRLRGEAFLLIAVKHLALWVVRFPRENIHHMSLALKLKHQLINGETFRPKVLGDKGDSHVRTASRHYASRSHDSCG